MILLEPRGNHLPTNSIIAIGVSLFVLFALLLTGMVLCWKNPQVRRWIGDCTPWRWKREGNGVNKGLGIEGAGDLEGGNSRAITPNAEGDLKPELLHTATYSELAREKELRENTTKFNSRIDVATTVPEPVASSGSPRLVVSKALRYVTKDAQHFLFPSFSRPVKGELDSTLATSPRKYSFRTARAVKKGEPGTKLTISAPVYGELPTLTLSLPTMTLSWANYEPTIAGSESSEHSPTSTLPFTDCAETLSGSEDVSTVDYEAFNNRLSNFDEFRDNRKRLSVHSQMSGVSIISADTGKVSFAQVAMRPESRPTLQIIGPCESPKRVVVVHY